MEHIKSLEKDGVSISIDYDREIDYIIIEGTYKRWQLWESFQPYDFDVYGLRIDEELLLEEKIDYIIEELTK